MKIEEFDENRVELIADLLSDETQTVKKIFLSSRTDRADVFYVFYEDAEDQLAKEKEELSKLEKVAQELEKDEDYGKLKNSTQRTLHLLAKYSIPSGQATKVIELVNMRKILSGETEWKEIMEKRNGKK